MAGSPENSPDSIIASSFPWTGLVATALKSPENGSPGLSRPFAKKTADISSQLAFSPTARSPASSPEKIAPELDFVSMHIYPREGHLEQDLKTLQGFCVGKPVVIEEIFPIHCGEQNLRNFLLDSRKCASGWISFYWGQTPEELRKSTKLPDALIRSWLNTFQEVNFSRDAKAFD